MRSTESRREKENEVKDRKEERNEERGERWWEELFSADACRRLQSPQEEEVFLSDADAAVQNQWGGGRKTKLKER